MTEDEYKTLLLPTKKVESTISIKDLKNKDPRTLLWGYTADRWSHHVYIEAEKIQVFVYEGRETISDSAYQSGELVPRSTVPNKRLYPEACDIEFCRLLRELNILLPFTSWDDMREKQQYYGKRYSEYNQELCNTGKIHNESMCSQHH